MSGAIFGVVRGIDGHRRSSPDGNMAIFRSNTYWPAIRYGTSDSSRDWIPSKIFPPPPPQSR